MAFEYEALVGHLNIVGGRAISAAPPGAMVEVAPAKAARGREADTYFTLVLPSGAFVAPASFYENMAQLSADKYFESAGSVTAALREVLTYLNQNLAEHNRQQPDRPFLADMGCAVLRGEDLIIARCGSAAAGLWQDGDLVVLPGDSTEEAGQPLGAAHVPEVKFTRHKVASGTRLILGDSNLSQLNPTRVTAALGELGLDLALVRMKENALLALTLLAVEFVPPELPSPQPLPEGESSAAVQQAVRVAESGKKAGAQAPTASGLGFVFVMLGRTFGGLAGAIGRALGLVSGGIDRTFGPDPEGTKRWFQSPLVTGAAVLIPVMLVGLVVALWLGGTGQTEYEICLSEARNLADIARAVPSSNPDNLRSAWTAVIGGSGRCLTLRPDDEDVTKLLREGQGVIDTLNQVTRREAILLDTLPDATFTRILLQGLDVYVLDSSRQRVYTTTLNQDGLSVTRKLTPVLDMSKGATVNGYPVGDFIDIGFSTASDALFALDRNGVLVICRRRQVQACEAQQLNDSEEWQQPVSIGVWGTDDRIYILDVAANQIWRYDRAGGSYSGIANPYFDGTNQGALQLGIDFKIDRDGNIFILRADGVIIKYFRAQVQQFRLGGFPPGQEPSGGQSLTLDEDPIGRAIYITNRDTRTVHELTLGGTFDANIQALDEAVFSSLGGVASNPAQQLLYVASGNGIFVIQK
ncbi:MAG: hypothetical protein IPK52_10175 [Chloroflexi bacterium]|nr:hypothetical protein [Chloroflexota bacterium]